MEPEYQTVSQMYERLLLMIRQRNDTGFRFAVTDAVLQPRNPFEPAKRRPKPTVAIAVSLFVVLALVFLYFLAAIFVFGGDLNAAIIRARKARKEGGA